MKESVTYQAIVEEGIQKGRQEGLIEGQVQEARRVVLKIGTTQFKCSPNPDQLKVLESIREPEKLENLMDRLLAGQVNNWSSFLSPASPTHDRDTSLET